MYRITKREAFKRFCNGEAFYLCPCKCHPFPPFSMACLMLSGEEWKEHAERYRNDASMWAGSLERTAWALMYNNWAYYNANYECGYYAHYYAEGVDNARN